MRGLILGAVVVAMAAVSAGCATPAANGSAGTATATASPSTGSPTAAVSPTSTSAADFVMSAQGIGPYRIGTTVEQLRNAGLLGPSTPLDPAHCADLFEVQAAGPYLGTLLLVVRGDVLVQVGTAGGDPSPRSPEGATVGMSWAEIRGLFGARGTMRKDLQGNQGFVVASGDKVMHFTGHPVRPGVGYFAAGLADYTLRVFLTGATC